MSDDLPSGKRIWELTERAIQIEKFAQDGCSLCYELFVADLCEQADGAMLRMNATEKRFFETLLRENYVKHCDRGEDWQSSYEIRSELRQELEGDCCWEDPFESRSWDDRFEWESEEEELEPYQGDNVGKVALDNDKEVRMVVEQIQRAGGERRISSAAGLERVMSPQQELGQQVGMKR